MSLYNLEKPNYKFDKIEFKTDHILNKRIKPPFPNQSFFMCIIGKARSGKTTFLINMLTNKNIYRKVFDKIFLAVPQSSRKSLKNDIFEDLPEEQKFNELSPELFNTIHETGEELINDEGKRPKQQLLIIDDLAVQLKQYEYELKQLMFNRRHIRLSVIILSQTLRSIPQALRFQTSQLIFFRSSNNLELEIIREEYIMMEKKKFINFVNFVFDTKHNFIFIDKDDELYYKNFQKIIL